MKVKRVMTAEVQSCTPETDLAAAALIMRENDLRALPVVDSRGTGHVYAIITDRDICMALAKENRLASEMHVWEAVSLGIRSCLPDDDIGYALGLMEAYKIRHLPVVNDDGVLQGILSIDDLVRWADSKKGNPRGSPSYIQVMRTLKAISEDSRPPRRPSRPYDF